MCNGQVPQATWQRFRSGKDGENETENERLVIPLGFGGSLNMWMAVHDNNETSCGILGTENILGKNIRISHSYIDCGTANRGVAELGQPS